MVNDCSGLGLQAHRASGQSLGQFIGWSGVMLTCLSRRILGLNGSRRFKRRSRDFAAQNLTADRSLRFDVTRDFLDDVWINEFSNDTNGMA